MKFLYLLKSAEGEKTKIEEIKLMETLNKLIEGQAIILKTIKFLENYIQNKLSSETKKTIQKTNRLYNQIDDSVLISEAKNIVIQEGRASSSLLQRKLKIGYARAARIIDVLEKDGLIGGFNGASSRVLINKDLPKTSF